MFYNAVYNYQMSINQISTNILHYRKWCNKPFLTLKLQFSPTNYIILPLQNDILFLGRNRNNEFWPISLSPVNQHTCNLICFFWAMGERRQIKKNRFSRKLAKFWKKKSQNFPPSDFRFWHPTASTLAKNLSPAGFLFWDSSVKKQTNHHFFLPN